MPKLMQIKHNPVERTGNLVVHHETKEEKHLRELKEKLVFKTDPYPFGRVKEDFVLRA